jgi:hypothetical protein
MGFPAPSRPDCEVLADSGLPAAVEEERRRASKNCDVESGGTTGPTASDLMLRVHD